MSRRIPTTMSELQQAIRDVTDNQRGHPTDAILFVCMQEAASIKDMSTEDIAQCMVEGGFQPITGAYDVECWLEDWIFGNDPETAVEEFYSILTHFWK